MAVDVVDAKIPLLISLAAMKKANAVIHTAMNMNMNIATICGQHIRLGRAGGHHTISVRKGGAEVVKEDPNDALKNDEVTVIKKEGEKGSEKEVKDDETETQKENEGGEMQVQETE